MRSRRPLAFKPSTSLALEDRIVLSEAGMLGLMGPALAQSAAVTTTVDDADDVFRLPSALPERSQLMDILEQRINRAFGSFAEDYRVLRTNYFQAYENLLQQPGFGVAQQPGDNNNNDDNGTGNGNGNGNDGVAPPTTQEGLVAQFHEAVQQRTATLAEQIRSDLNDVQGGAGLLDNYGQARVAQLGRELVSIAPLGTSPLTTAEYSLLGEYAIMDALYATRQFTEVYDGALFQTAAGFWSGNLRFFRGGQAPAEQIAELSPAVGQVSDGMNQAYSEFVTDLRNLRTEYYQAVGEINGNGDNGNGENNNNNNNNNNGIQNGDPYENYRQAIANRAEQLRLQVIDVLNEPAGGAGVLNQFADTQLNQVQLLMANIPDVRGVPFGVEAHAQLTEEIVARSLNDMRAMVQLYDLSLFTTAMNFFQANPRFATGGVGQPGQPGVGQPGVGQPGGLIPDGPGTGPIGLRGGVGEGVGTAAQVAGLPGLGFAAPGGQAGFGTPLQPADLIQRGPTTGPIGLRQIGGGIGGGGLGGGLGGGFAGPGLPFFGTTPAGFDPTLGFGGLGGGTLPGFGRPITFGSGFGFAGQPFAGLGPAGAQFGQTLGFGATPGAFGLGNQFGVVAGPGTGLGTGFGGFFF